MANLSYRAIIFLFVLNAGSLAVNLCLDLYFDGIVNNFSLPLLALTLIYAFSFIFYKLTRSAHMFVR